MSSVIRVAAMAVAAGSRMRRTCDELEGEAVLEELGGGADALEQELRPQAGHVGAVAPSDVQHAGGHQGADRLPDRAAAGAQQLGQLGLGRQRWPRRSWPTAMRSRTCWMAASVNGAATFVPPAHEHAA